MATSTQPTSEDYRESIENLAEEIESDLEETQDHYAIHEIIEVVANESDWTFNKEQSLMSIMASNTHPDTPEYCESWDTYVGQDDSCSEVVSAMAFTCVYDDVAGHLDSNTELLD